MIQTFVSTCIIGKTARLCMICTDQQNKKKGGEEIDEHLVHGTA
jgi:hypothetical protein